MDYNKIEKSHFVGISLGSILIQKMIQLHSNRVEKIGLGGAILNLNLQSRFLMFMGKLTQSVLPFIWIYTFFAYVIMPNKNHRESRSLFVNEAKKLYQKEFKKWFQLTSELVPLLKFFRQIEVKIPTLYVMGSEDYMFLPSVRNVVGEHLSSQLQVIHNCGHVVNVDSPKTFNSKMFEFLSKSN